MPFNTIPLFDQTWYNSTFCTFNFLVKLLLCSNIHIVSKYFEPLEDVVLGYLAQVDTYILTSVTSNQTG